MSIAPSLLPIFAAALATSANAQPCEPAWRTDLTIGPQGTVFTLAEFDEDGSGPARPSLFAGGFFLQLTDGTPLRRFARFDGQRWLQIGEGLGSPTVMDDGVIDLAVFDVDHDGPLPPRLIVAGDFSVTIADDTQFGIVAWDGTGFSSVGLDRRAAVHAMGVWDEDGAGPGPPALYIIGDVAGALAPPVRGVMKWDGITWSALPFPPGWSADYRVLRRGAFQSFDPDGDGPAPEQLYVAAAFTDAATGRGGVARWTGTDWEMVGGGLGPEPFLEIVAMGDLAVLDGDGDGPAFPRLIACGGFQDAGDTTARRVAAWDGESWSPMSEVNVAIPATLAVFDLDGDGPELDRLYLSGYPAAPSGSRILRWDNGTWTNVATLSGTYYNGADKLLSTVRLGTPTLYVGGTFTNAGVPASNFAAYLGCPRRCTGDVNSDQQVDLADLINVLGSFGTQSDATFEQGDLNGDGDVDLWDLAALLARFGSDCE